MSRSSDFLTIHHIVPRSRLAELGLQNSKENTMKIRRSLHDAWNSCFHRMTPWEVVDFLEDLGQLFGKENKPPILLLALEQWYQNHPATTPWERFFQLMEYQKGREFVRSLEIIFGRHTSIEKMITIVRRDWSGKDGRFVQPPSQVVAGTAV